MDFAKYCGELDRKLTELIHIVLKSNDQGVADLKNYLEKIAPGGQFDNNNLQRARVATLVKMAQSKEAISIATSQTLVSEIQGRLNQITGTLRQVNVILLPGGALEHYLPSYSGCPYNLTEDAKRKAVEDEIDYLASENDVDLKNRYKELFDSICQLPSKPPVNIEETLKKHLGNYVHELQGLVINHPEWSSNEEFNNYFTKATSGFGKLFKVKTFDRMGPNEFKAVISVLGLTNTWTVEVSNNTNAGMREFSLQAEV